MTKNYKVTYQKLFLLILSKNKIIAYLNSFWLEQFSKWVLVSFNEVFLFKTHSSSSLNKNYFYTWVFIKYLFLIELVHNLDLDDITSNRADPVIPIPLDVLFLDLSRFVPLTFLELTDRRMVHFQLTIHVTHGCFLVNHTHI